MKLSRVLPAIATAALAAGLGTGPASAAPSNDIDPKIIDGGLVSDAPWAARLLADGQVNCTATIISPRWVLTAEHCVATGAISFRIGNVNQSQGEPANAVRTEVNPEADLALAELDHDVQTTYAALEDGSAVQPGQQAQVFGWGATCTDRPEIDCQSEQLKVATVNVTGVDAPCVDYRGGNAVCADRGDGITAGGDSGGPMMVGPTQVGVASTSDRESSTAYTHIAPYREWIRQTAGV